MASGQNGGELVGWAATDALLVLEDGTVFRGRSYGSLGSTFGEVVFQTGMTGYQEALTDPSYHGQIVVQTAPHIGNTGWNDEDDESPRVQVAGYVVRDPSRSASNWRSRRALEDELAAQGVVGMAGVDTRSLTRRIREHGAMRAGVFSGDALTRVDEMAARVLESPVMAGADLAGAVSTPEPYVRPAAGESRFRVVALDLGIKANILRELSTRGVETHVLPVASTLDRVLEAGPHGVFLSNGPGDPAAMTALVELTAGLLERRVPLFGICFGNQILGRALGRATHKMRYGHRGVNIPVVEAATGRVSITAQNHGFTVEGEAGERFDSPFGRVLVSHHCPNDGSVEGLRCLEAPAFSVQYHPEAAAGPHDAASLFDEFTSLMDGNR
jgi:carbamoyl-phosphate synthase small subunit